MTTIIGELRRRMRGLCTGLALLLCTSSTMSAQIGPSPAGRAAKQNLAWLDFTATPVGDFPSNIAMLDGVMNVVDVNGRHMLRASSTSAFLIQLPQVLPVDFTIEVDLIPKVGAKSGGHRLRGLANDQSGIVVGQHPLALPQPASCRRSGGQLRDTIPRITRTNPGGETHPRHHCRRGDDHQGVHERSAALDIA
jgi:hypothetical protein